MSPSVKTYLEQRPCVQTIMLIMDKDLTVPQIKPLTAAILYWKCATAEQKVIFAKQLADVPFEKIYDLAPNDDIAREIWRSILDNNPDHPANVKAEVLFKYVRAILSSPVEVAEETISE